jgi:3-isopropylmalate dehydrogenase
MPTTLKISVNPIAQILSTAMMLRHSFHLEAAATRIEAAVHRAIANGLRTRDIWSEGMQLVSTREMGSEIRANLTGGPF